MIVFFDTSALLKLYVDEAGAEKVRAFLDSDADLTASLISYVEMHSALARRTREGSLSAAAAKSASDDFEADWFQFAKIPPEDPLLRKAARLCQKHPIRSLDAIQLASALSAAEQWEEPLLFLTADKRLEAAARREKLRTEI